MLVDGEPRVSCVTPLRRVEGRAVTTLEGLGDDAERWCDALCDAGGSQCGFCTPGIVVRLEWLRRRGSLGDPAAVDRSLAAHLCRCTGWNTITEAVGVVAVDGPRSAEAPLRDLDAASLRATIEGRVPQRVGPDIAAGRAPFADDTAPPGALVALVGADGEWVVGEDLAEARAASGKVQGRRTTEPAVPPIDVPPGDWAVTLRTGWVEPAYLEADVAWCVPGGEPPARSPTAAHSAARSAPHWEPSPVSWPTDTGEPSWSVGRGEDVVRGGPKRPPIAAGVRSDGTGVIRVASTAGVAAAIAAAAPELVVEEVDVVGPPTSIAVRGAGWVEAAILVAAARGDDEIRSPEGAVASVSIGDDGLAVRVRCGDVLDEVVLRSYCVGAVHMALGWVTSESLAVDQHGSATDLTIRSYGILRPSDMPAVSVELVDDGAAPVCGSDAVFAATALAAWRHQGLPPQWPTGVAFGP